MKLQVKIDDQTYKVEIADLQSRPILATVDGEIFEVWPEEGETIVEPASSASLPLPAKSAPRTKPSRSSGNEKEVSAPIPGVILEIIAKPGDQVKHGQELLILEAMKMKNIIRANRDGRISEIHVNPGVSVVHGQLLITFTD
ncbi:MAG: hypothetical protein JEZ06_02630 [Anaerolineaceae bacterium]|nr:hypothetical protein [Anaerolineaceae bacterium]